jgi:pilus assembly protein CpaF
MVAHVTEAFPIVVFIKKLEDNSRRIMEITEMEIADDWERKLHTLYQFNVKENRLTSDGKIEVVGNFEKSNDISENLKKRFLENGLPLATLNTFTNGGKFN